MRVPAFLSIALSGALLACSSPSGPPADRVVYRGAESSSPSLAAMSARAVAPSPAPAQRYVVPEATDAERMAWFESHGSYPYAYRPVGDQSLGYVRERTDWGWVMPTILTAGALYGLYEIKRHND